MPNPIIAAALALLGAVAAGVAPLEAQTRVGGPAPPEAAGQAPRADDRSGVDAGSAGTTADQARTRIEGAGYSDVTNLRQDGEGVWHGRAMRSGNAVEVSVDREGHITATPMPP